MPKRVSWYECRYCARQYDTHDEAAACESECEKVNTCSICTCECPPGMWRRSVDAANVEHHICPRCWQDITGWPVKQKTLAEVIGVETGRHPCKGEDEADD